MCQSAGTYIRKSCCKRAVTMTGLTHNIVNLNQKTLLHTHEGLDQTGLLPNIVSIQIKVTFKYNICNLILSSIWEWSSLHNCYSDNNPDIYHNYYHKGKYSVCLISYIEGKAKAVCKNLNQMLQNIWNIGATQLSTRSRLLDERVLFFWQGSKL